MVEKVEELLLPNAVVQRIIKEALPDGINVAKDARAAISRAASIFVLYLSSTARDQLKTRKQKTLTPADVIQALEAMEMEHFVEPLKKAMDRKLKLLRFHGWEINVPFFQSTNTSRRIRKIKNRQTIQLNAQNLPLRQKNLQVPKKKQKFLWRTRKRKFQTPKKWPWNTQIKSRQSKSRQMKKNKYLSIDMNLRLSTQQKVTLSDGNIFANESVDIHFYSRTL